MKYSANLKNGLKDLLNIDNKIILLGEDIGEPYGGAFGITKGLQNDYPNRIIQTPMAEGALASICVGLALNGYKPILEIMFGDFITLCADGLINHASKFVGLYNKELNMVIRTPMGGYRGYGATHSQTIEKIFFGIPNINIMAMNILQQPSITLYDAIYSGNPTILIENKLDYGKNLFDDYNKYDVNYKSYLNTYYVNIKNESNVDGYIVLYGGMVTLGLEIIWDIFINQEINLGLIIPIEISPFNKKILDVVKNKDLYVLEESNKEGGFSSEVARIILENNININKFKIFSARNKCIPSSILLEEYILPNKDLILEGLKDGN